MIRLWIKFKEQAGKRVVDKATFQSFGCETAIAVASLATEMIREKRPRKFWPCPPKNLPPVSGRCLRSKFIAPNWSKAPCIPPCNRKSAPAAAPPAVGSQFA